MNTRHAPALLLLALLAAPLAAQETLTTGTPEAVGMSPAPLKEGVELFRKAVDRDDLRGAVLLVARKGRIVLWEPVGWSNKEKQEPMRQDTIFHVASNTKAVTATAVLMLVEEGKLDLDAPVCKYLPSFDNEKARTITVRQLLTHTSGLRISEIFLKPLMPKSAEHPDAPCLRLEVDRFGAIGAAEPPGKSYSYNNAGYNTLGALIEVTSGKPLEKFFDERLYDPLGMTQTANRDRPGVVEHRACIYRRTNNTWKMTYHPGDKPEYPFVRASGGMLTTAENYARFLQMVVNRGTFNGHRLLSAESITQATSPQTKSIYSEAEQKKRTTYYGFGWQVSTDGTYHHSGSDGTSVWVDPKHEVFAVMFTQSPGGKIPTEEFVKLVRQSIQQ